MVWWYELRGEGNRLIKMQRGFRARQEARRAAEQSKRLLHSLETGGWLALYTTNKVIVGGVGVSGDTSCTDHDVAWRVRHNLGLDHLLGVGGVSGDANRPDNIIYDIIANPDGTGGAGQNLEGLEAWGQARLASAIRSP